MRQKVGSLISESCDHYVLRFAKILLSDAQILCYWYDLGLENCTFWCNWWASNANLHCINCVLKYKIKVVFNGNIGLVAKICHIFQQIVVLFSVLHHQRCHLLFVYIYLEPKRVPTNICSLVATFAKILNAKLPQITDKQRTNVSMLQTNKHEKLKNSQRRHCQLCAQSKGRRTKIHWTLFPCCRIIPDRPLSGLLNFWYCLVFSFPSPHCTRKDEPKSSTLTFHIKK